MKTKTPPLRADNGWLTTTPEILATALRLLFPEFNYGVEESERVARDWLHLYEYKPSKALNISRTCHDHRMTLCLFHALQIPTPSTMPQVIEALSTPPKYAEFNRCPHLEVDVPDGYFTISARMTNGKRVTFAFVQTKGPNGQPHPAGCVDIEYHDGPKVKVPDGRMLNSFHSIGFTAGSNTYDTRKVDKPTTLITVLVDDEYYPKS